MTFLNANNFLNQLKAPSLSADEQAIVNFYQAVGDFSVAMINYRADHNLNQKEFAEFLGTTQSNVSRFESGVYNFSMKKLFELAAQMNIDVDVCIKGVKTCERKHSTANHQPDENIPMPETVASGLAPAA